MKETKFKKALGSIDEDKSYSAEEALELILKQPKRKFQETVDISVWLGIDPKKSEQNIRGSLTLPNSLGKEVKVAAFVDSDKADEAKKGGADFIGLDVCLSILEVMYDGFGNPKYAPNPLLVNMVKAGKLGVKSGIITSENQTQGKGQYGRKWISLKGNIFNVSYTHLTLPTKRIV